MIYRLISMFRLSLKPTDYIIFILATMAIMSAILFQDKWIEDRAIKKEAHFHKQQNLINTCIGGEDSNYNGFVIFDKRGDFLGCLKVPVHPFDELKPEEKVRVYPRRFGLGKGASMQLEELMEHGTYSK